MDESNELSGTANENDETRAKRLFQERLRELWLQTPGGKLCMEFYQKFQEYKRYLETHRLARERVDGGPLDVFPEHALFEQGLRSIKAYEEERAERDRRNLEQARRAARCEHRHADGRRCESPRMKEKHFCYRHEQFEQSRATKVDLGPMEDAASIQLAIARLQKAIIEGTVEARQSGQLGYLIQLAAWNAKNIQPAEPEEAIELEEEVRKAATPAEASGEQAITAS